MNVRNEWNDLEQKFQAYQAKKIEETFIFTVNIKIHRKKNGFKKSNHIRFKIQRLVFTRSIRMSPGLNPKKDLQGKKHYFPCLC